MTNGAFRLGKVLWDEFELLHNEEYEELSPPPPPYVTEEMARAGRRQKVQRQDTLCSGLQALSPFTGKERRGQDRRRFDRRQDFAKREARQSKVQTNAYHEAVHALPGHGQTALCLSGGGIRSAAFSLGVIQALARKGALEKFDYLSTVSGGGYIGSWLTAWLHRKPLGTVLHDLGPWPAKAEQEPPEIHWLRRYHNFISPMFGMASGDTWTVIAQIGRNLFLNWLVFLPLICAVLTVPLLFNAAADAIGSNSVFETFLKQSPPKLDAVFRHAKDAGDTAPSALLAFSSFFREIPFGALSIRSFGDLIGALLVFMALTVSAANRPTSGMTSLSGRLYFSLVFVPGWLGASLLVLSAAHYIHYPLLNLKDFLRFCLIISLLFILARLASLLYQPAFAARRPALQLSYELLAWVFSGIATGALIWLGLVMLQSMHSLDRQQADMRNVLTVVGTPWIILSLLAGEAIFVGLSSRLMDGDRDREWLGRAAGVFSAASCGWLIVAFCVTYSIQIVDFISRSYLFVVGFFGLAALLGGASSISAANAKAAARERLPISQIVSILSGCFLLSVMTFIAAELQHLLEFIHEDVGTKLGFQRGQTFYLAKNGMVFDYWKADLVILSASGIALIFVSQAVSFFVDVNWFSLHAIYRNRLVKAFLGATNATEDRNAFDGFSDSDNIRFGVLRRRTSGTLLGHGLFPVINVALNLVAGKELAWRDRKAESFTFTPLHAGNPTIQYRDAKEYGEDVTLGTAMAISGAAVSPNWGYHSSTITGLVMMLFNLRLGWWLGNPMHVAAWKASGPRSSFRHLLREAFGKTDSDQGFVYLTDGGHFENLGAYEMIRRRCRHIVVSDAGHDPKCTLEDLGDLVRKVKIDMGVKINFKKLQLARQTEPPLPGFYCAVGTVEYPELEGNFDKFGYLLYIKPGLHGNLPADIHAYAAANSRFPHDSTLNQWFSESQFESYRALGSFIVDEISSAEELTARPAASPIQRLFEATRTYLAKPIPDPHGPGGSPKDPDGTGPHANGHEGRMSRKQRWGIRSRHLHS
jgi:hypothetical protein